RDGAPASILAADLVPGDIALVEEGDRIAADMRLISGGVEVDLSTLTGESAPVLRSAELIDTGIPRIEARDLLFSGTSATGGEAQGLVFATGMHTELGRIAALSERVKEEPSPLERQVRKVAWLIAAIAIAMAVAFVPVAIFGAGLSFTNSVVFAVGLLAGNVPEGLLPVITLALAVAVRLLARRGALVKRLSAVETLGSTDVICTDKTGTLTQNQMRPVAVWTLTNEIPLDPKTSDPPEHTSDAALTALAETAAACNNAHVDGDGNSSGDPTEIALLIAAQTLGAAVNAASREHTRTHQYNFDAQRKLMSTIDTGEGHDWLHTKGAPEAVLPCCTTALLADGEHPMQPSERERVTRQVESFARQGLRVLALARKPLAHSGPSPRREDAERELCLLGLITMRDPPRPEVAEAVDRCHRAGIRIVLITGDHPLTAAAIAGQVGIGGADPVIVNAQQFDHLHEQEVKDILATGREVIFARASPETKLQIAEALRGQGHVVAMTGDGVNDAPALRTADIGVAMGRSGTDVAREASTMILTDDNFATIVTAVEAGRQVYDNVRKFIQYIFAHATPEVV
ncbi:MAG: cation-transporting P-type ATPase, partial [Solirubrobacteraceae bacterium]